MVGSRSSESALRTREHHRITRQNGLRPEGRAGMNRAQWAKRTPTAPRATGAVVLHDIPKHSKYPLDACFWYAMGYRYEFKLHRTRIS